MPQQRISWIEVSARIQNAARAPAGNLCRKRTFPMNA
jgi:hypothetical protein